MSFSIGPAARGTWTRLNSGLITATFSHTATLLPSGRVLVAGGAVQTTGFASPVDGSSGSVTASSATGSPVIQVQRLDNEQWRYVDGGAADTATYATPAVVTTTTLLVNAAPTTTAIGGAPAVPGGGSVVVTAAPGGATCAATVAAGQCAITFAAAGTYALTAQYEGSTNFLPSTASPATAATVSTNASASDINTLVIFRNGLQVPGDTQ